jgi:hypothetical protein
MLPYPSTVTTTNLFALGHHPPFVVFACFLWSVLHNISNVSIVSLHACTHCQILSQLFFFSNAFCHHRSITSIRYKWCSWFLQHVIQVCALPPFTGLALLALWL